MNKRIWIIGIVIVCLLAVGYLFFSNQNQGDLKRVDGLPDSPKSPVLERSPIATSFRSEDDIASSPEETDQPYVASIPKTTGKPDPSDNTNITPISTPKTTIPETVPPGGNPNETQPLIESSHSPWTLEDARPLSTPEVFGNIENNGFATIDGEILYMTDEYSEINKGRIVSINLRTGEKKVLVECSGACLNVKDGYLYYADITEGRTVNVGPLYRINLATGEKELIEKESVAFVYYTNNGMIYSEPYLKKKIYSSYDGSIKKDFLLEGGILGIINDYCYYYDGKTQTIGIYNIKTEEKTELCSHEFPQYISSVFTGNSLYYVNEASGSIEMFDFSAQETTIIHEGNVYQINLYKGNLIFLTRSVTQNEDLARYERDAYIIDLGNNSVTKLSNKFGDMGAIIGDKMVSFLIPMEDSYSQIIVTDIK